MPTIKGQDHVTNSCIECFETCRKKFYWSYELGWRPDVTSVPLRIGTMVHEGLDMLAKGVEIEDVLDCLTTLYYEKMCDVNDEYAYKLSIEAQTVICLVREYAIVWANSKIKIIESETSFDLPIINPDGNPMKKLRQAGKRDRLCELPDSRIALMETKTCSEDILPGSEYRQITAINQQISMYVNAALAEGKQIDTTLYDCIRKPDIKAGKVPVLDAEGLKIVNDNTGQRVLNGNGSPRQTASTANEYVILVRPMRPDEWADKLTVHIKADPERYFQRFEVPRMADDLEEFNTELWMSAQEIMTCRRLGRWKRMTGSCRKWNSLCPYYPLCAGERDLSNGVPAGFRQVLTVHEELE